MVLPRSQAVRIRVRLGSGDDMSTSECLGTSVMSRYGRIRYGNDLPDQRSRDSTLYISLERASNCTYMYTLVVWHNYVHVLVASLGMHKLFSDLVCGTLALWVPSGLCIHPCGQVYILVT